MAWLWSLLWAPVSALQSLPVPVSFLLSVLVILLFFWTSGSTLKTDSNNSTQANAGATEAALSFCRSLGAPDSLHEEGSFVPATEFLTDNTAEGLPFHNEFADGMFISLNRAPAKHDPGLSANPSDFPYEGYFRGKKRRWELRVQLRFKKGKPPPTVGELFFGIELEGYVPMSRATKRTMETLVGMLKKVVGNQVYHSPGDDPSTTSGELEKPVFAMPLWAFDQFIVTPEGEEPPNLADPAIPSMGSKRFKRVRQFKAELEKLELRVGPAYTFCFWGISQWLDKLNWEVNMPFSSLDFNLFCGTPPVHAVIYSLKGSLGAGRDRRHLQSNKQKYFHVAFWSSKCRPRLDRIQALLKESEHDGPPKSLEDAGCVNTLGRSLSKRNGGQPWYTCCAAR